MNRTSITSFESMIERRWIAAIPVLLSIIMYWQTLQFDFVTYDDYELVYQNGDYLSQLSNIATSFKTHAFVIHREESAYYRPILLVSYIFDYQVWKLTPMGYHLTNMILHSLTVILVFLLIERLVRKKVVALVASLFFAVHPIQTESVSWIAGRNDLLLGFFVVLMMYAYVTYRENTTTRRRYYWIAVAAFTCALFTKESGAFYILLFPLYDLCSTHRDVRGLLDRSSLRHFFLMAIMLILYLGVRRMVFGETIGAFRLYGGGTTLWTRLNRVPELLAEHLSFLLLPMHLSVVHPIEQIFWFHTPWSLFALLGTLLFVAILLLAWKRDRTLCFGISWFAVGMLPALNLFPVAVQVLEHRLYVPMVGFVLALAYAGYLFVARREERPSNKKIYVSIAGVCAAVCVVISFGRIPVWKNSETIWRDAIEKAPAYSRSYFNLAGWYFERGEYEKTTNLMEKYIVLEPNDLVGYSKLRQSYYLAGNYNDAVRVCKTMISLAPANANRYIETAELYMQLNQPDSAIAIYKEGIRRNPTAVQLCDLLGRVYVRTNNESEAEQWYIRAIEIDPQFAQAYFDVGVLYASAGQSDRAQATIEKGMLYGTPKNDVAQLLYQLYLDGGQPMRADSIRRLYKF